MERRKVGADQTRTNILEAARKLLVSEHFREFTMEAVAKAADVSRLTVYYQFNSRAGLLEGLYNHIATGGYIGMLPDVFREGNDPVQKLHRFIEVFVRFWASNREVIRRLHALGAIDAEIGHGLRERNQRRRNGLQVIVEHYCRNYFQFIAMQGALMLDVLHMLTSFETYDALAASGRSTDEIVAIIRKLVDQAIGMSPRPVSQYTAPPVKPPERKRRSRRRKRR